MGRPLSLGRLRQDEDAVAATVAGMDSTGATIIGEWADARGKWFAVGAYATGLYGTRDWRKVEYQEITAPPGAHRGSQNDKQTKVYRS